MGYFEDLQRLGVMLQADPPEPVAILALADQLRSEFRGNERTALGIAVDRVLAAAHQHSQYPDSATDLAVLRSAAAALDKALRDHLYLAFVQPDIPGVTPEHLLTLGRSVADAIRDGVDWWPVHQTLTDDALTSLQAALVIKLAVRW